MNESRVLGHFVPAFGKIVAMMAIQHVPPLHGGRASVALHSASAPRSKPAAARTPALATILIHKLLPGNRTVLYVTLFLHRHRQGPHLGSFDRRPRAGAGLCPRLGFSPADTGDRRLA